MNVWLIFRIDKKKKVVIDIINKWNKKKIKTNDMVLIWNFLDCLKKYVTRKVSFINGYLKSKKSSINYKN